MRMSARQSPPPPPPHRQRRGETLIRKDKALWLMPLRISATPRPQHGVGGGTGIAMHRLGIKRRGNVLRVLKDVPVSCQVVPWVTQQVTEPVIREGVVPPAQNPGGERRSPRHLSGEIERGQAQARRPRGRCGAAGRAAPRVVRWAESHTQVDAGDRSVKNSRKLGFTKNS